MGKEDVEHTVSNLFNTVESKNSNSSFLTDIKQKYSFKKMHNNIMSGILNLVVSWIMSCFSKYTEEQFHQKMSSKFMYNGYYYTGFDFIGDWEKNHRQKYNSILAVIRKTGVKLDKQQLYLSIIDTIKKQGWNISKDEARCFEFTVMRLYNILYL